jgi:hypothetical protein
MADEDVASTPSGDGGEAGCEAIISVRRMLPKLRRAQRHAGSGRIGPGCPPTCVVEVNASAVSETRETKQIECLAPTAKLGDSESTRKQNVGSRSRDRPIG